eukprot:scaffold8097_cov258-Pinguiococcus_pyrenoidosus.AAC.5
MRSSGCHLDEPRERLAGIPQAGQALDELEAWLRVVHREHVSPAKLPLQADACCQHRSRATSLIPSRKDYAVPLADGGLEHGNVLVNLQPPGQRGRGWQPKALWRTDAPSLPVLSH